MLFMDLKPPIFLRFNLLMMPSFCMHYVFSDLYLAGKHNCEDIKAEKDSILMEKVITSEDTIEKLGRLVRLGIKYFPDDVARTLTCSIFTAL